MSSASTIKAGGAYVELTANDSKLRAGLAGAESRLARFGAGVGSLQKRMNGMSYGFAKTAQSVNAVSVGMMSVGGKLLGVGMAMGGALGYAVKHFMDLGDQMDKMSARTGATVEWLSQMRYAADMCGTDIDKLESSLTNMNKTLADAAEGRGAGFRWLQQLGIDLDSLKGMDTAGRFEQIADGISRVEDSALRARMSTAIFRDSGAMLPLIGDVGYDLNIDVEDNDARKTLKQLGLDAQEMLHLTPDMQVNAVKSALAQIDNEQKRKSLKSKTLKEKPSNIASLKDEAVKFGALISTDQATKAAELNDALARLKFAVSGLVFQIGSKLAPQIEKLANKVAEYVPNITNLIDQHGGAIWSTAQLAVGISGLALVFTAIGGALQPIIWGFQGLSLGARGVSTSIGLVVGGFGKLYKAYNSVKTATLAVKGFRLDGIGFVTAKLKSLKDASFGVFKALKNARNLAVHFGGRGNFLPEIYVFLRHIFLMLNVVRISLARLISGKMSLKQTLSTLTFTVRILSTGMLTVFLQLSAALGGLVFIGWLVYKNWSTVVWSIKEAAKSVWNFIKNIFDLLMSGVKWVTDSIKTMVNNVKTILTDSFGMIVKAFKLGDIKSVFEILKITVSSVLLSIKKDAAQTASEFLTFFYDTFVFVGERGRLAFSELWYYIRVGWGESIGWLGYALDVVWLKMKHGGINAIYWLEGEWKNTIEDISGLFLKMFAALQKGWLRVKGLFDGGLNVELEVAKVESNLIRQLADLSDWNDTRKTSDARKAKQREELDFAKSHHDSSRALERERLYNDHEAEKAKIRQYALDAVSGNKIFGGAIESATAKLKENEAKLAKIKHDIKKKEDAKNAQTDKPAKDKSRNIHVRRVMADFSLKNLDFRLYQSSNDLMVEHQKKMLEQQKRQAELTLRTNQVLYDIATTRGMHLRFN